MWLLFVCTDFGIKIVSNDSYFLLSLSISGFKTFIYDEQKNWTLNYCTIKRDAAKKKDNKIKVTYNVYILFVFQTKRPYDNSYETFFFEIYFRLCMCILNILLILPNQVNKEIANQQYHRLTGIQIKFNNDEHKSVNH